MRQHNILYMCYLTAFHFSLQRLLEALIFYSDCQKVLTLSKSVHVSVGPQLKIPDLEFTTEGKYTSNYFWSVRSVSVWCLIHAGCSYANRSWYETVVDLSRHDPPWMTCLLVHHVQHQLLQKPPTAELWCVAHYLFIFGLFIPGIQAVTLAGDSKWCWCINHGPVCRTGGEMTRRQKGGSHSHHGV